VDAHQDGPLKPQSSTCEGQDAPPVICLDQVSKRFGETLAVDHVSLDIARGEFFCLVGASGSGKTTLLRLIAGFEQPDTGHVLIDGEDMTARPAYRRPVNMMFQSYALFPHLSVERNIAFGLQEEGRPKAEIRERVRAALEMLDMDGLAKRKPHQLSGGQRQRVALARALIKQPKILLLDEPLAALDKKLRERAQSELVSLRARVGITFVMVTHDQEEAMSMATRIALMRDGAIVQMGSPSELYDAPKSRFAADFFGAANLFVGRVTAAGKGEAVVESSEAGAILRGRWDSGVAAGAPVAVMVRPEQVRLSREAPVAENVLRGHIRSRVFLGSSTTCHVMLDSGKIVVARLSPGELAAAGSPADGDVVHLSWLASAARVLVE
jgi:putrescine transport system ATP-binding protein